MEKEEVVHWRVQMLASLQDGMDKLQRKCWGTESDQNNWRVKFLASLEDGMYELRQKIEEMDRAAEHKNWRVQILASLQDGLYKFERKCWEMDHTASKKLLEKGRFGDDFTPEEGSDFSQPLNSTEQTGYADHTFFYHTIDSYYTGDNHKSSLLRDYVPHRHLFLDYYDSHRCGFLDNYDSHRCRLLDSYNYHNPYNHTPYTNHRSSFRSPHNYYSLNESGCEIDETEMIESGRELEEGGREPSAERFTDDPLSDDTQSLRGNYDSGPHDPLFDEIKQNLRRTKSLGAISEVDAQLSLCPSATTVHLPRQSHCLEGSDKKLQSHCLEGRCKCWKDICFINDDHLSNEAVSAWGNYEFHGKDPWFDDDASLGEFSDRLRRTNSLNSIKQPRVRRGWRLGGRPREGRIARPHNRHKYESSKKRSRRCVEGLCKCWRDIDFLDRHKVVSVWGNYESHGKNPWFDDDASFEENFCELTRTKSLNSIERPRVRRDWKRVGGRPRESRIRRPYDRHSYWSDSDS